MSFHMSTPASSRETEAKQIDHNDSIRSTYFTKDELSACGMGLARDGAPALPAFAAFDFFARHKENEREILRVYRATAADVAAVGLASVTLGRLSSGTSSWMVPKACGSILIGLGIALVTHQV